MDELYCAYHFQTAIYQIHRPEWVDRTLDLLSEHYEDSYKESELKKIFPVYQTDDISKDRDLSYLINFILENSYRILESQGYDLSDHALLFDEMWAQDVMTYGHHFPHVHQNCQISGFYFLECPEEGIYPLFYDPRPGKNMINLPEKNLDNVTLATYECNYKPVPGMFLFFNSWLPHSFQLNSSESNCKFIHFNISAKKKYGQSSS